MIALSDVNGYIVEKYSYDVFGDVTIRDANDTVISESAYGNPFYFTGRRLDDETGNYYYRNRYYNPDIGRFLQTDPIGYIAGLNLYTYCGNNPIMWVDPFGLKKDSLDAEKFLRDGRNRFYNPFRHTSEWDFAYNSKYANKIFRLPDGTMMNASEFANYMAGYMGAYHMGDFGFLSMRTMGNLYENQENYSWYDPRSLNPFSGDCEDSKRDINRGYEDGVNRKYQDYKETGQAAKEIGQKIWRAVWN